jgi:hypothetical protein
LNRAIEAINYSITRFPDDQILGSLITEYPANGSFSDHTHAVCMKLSRVSEGGT